MKSDPLTGILTVVLIAATLGAAAMCYKYLMLSREFQSLQQVVLGVNQRKALANQLAMDLAQYSTAHPEIKPLLEDINKQLQMRAATNAITNPMLQP